MVADIFTIRRMYVLIQRLCAALLLVSMTGTFVARSSRYEAFGGRLSRKGDSVDGLLIQI